MSTWTALANTGISMEMTFALMNQLIWNLQIVHWRILLLLELALLLVVLLPPTRWGGALWESCADYLRRSRCFTAVFAL